QTAARRARGAPPLPGPRELSRRSDRLSLPHLCRSSLEIPEYRSGPVGGLQRQPQLREAGGAGRSDRPAIGRAPVTALEHDAEVRLALYRHFAESGSAPAPEEIAVRLDLSRESVVESLRRLRAARTLFLEPDGETIRMAAPFSGVP